MARLARRFRSGSRSTAVVHHAIRPTPRRAAFEHRLDRVYFRFGNAGDGRSQRSSVAVDQEHDLGALPALGLADVGAPLLAGENVPSPIDSCQPFKFSEQTFSHTPDAVQSRCRRQQVRYIFPSGSRLQHPEDAVQAGARIDERPAGRCHYRLRGKIRNQKPLLIREFRSGSFLGPSASAADTGSSFDVADRFPLWR